MFRIMSNINVSAARSSLLTRLLALQPPVYTATTVSKDLCVGRMFPYQVHIVDDVQVRQNNRPQEAMTCNETHAGHECVKCTLRVQTQPTGTLGARAGTRQWADDERSIKGYSRHSNSNHGFVRPTTAGVARMGG
ncbi:hypothetical protein C8Q72DRAFT_220674 [Fomitopsis betulina]|nr:hypothetical protein C8Q72DRAFT_220674 [Fomitopsis betulina]